MGRAYVKPLISLNSCVIVPPWLSACFLALNGAMSLLGSGESRTWVWISTREGGLTRPFAQQYHSSGL